MTQTAVFATLSHENQAFVYRYIQRQTLYRSLSSVIFARCFHCNPLLTLGTSLSLDFGDLVSEGFYPVGIVAWAHLLL